MEEEGAHEQPQVANRKKRCLVVKEFTGLADSLLPVAAAYADEWELEVMEDFKDAYSEEYTLAERVDAVVARVRGDGPPIDMLIFEDPQSGAMATVEGLLTEDECRRVGLMHAGRDARRLEMDRLHGKQVCEELGIACVPVVGTLQRSKVREATMKEEYVAGDKVYAKLNGGPSISGGTLEEVMRAVG